MLELEKHLENPNDESRVRYLQGKDLPPAEMHEKIEDVSIALETFFLKSIVHSISNADHFQIFFCLLKSLLISIFCLKQIVVLRYIKNKIVFPVII